ncbi:MAG: prephenate dehydrogenase [Candidatus Omnitrophota bacterium]|nr:prephenate dehydrogenase [Candidatus Omnitrophota bacterium]
MFKKITIIGLGLIGGSLGLAIKKKKLAKEVIGVSRRKSTIDYALEEGIADSVTLDLKKGVKDSDFIIITTPVLTIVSIAKMAAPFLKKGAILTDAGSTKVYIVDNIEKLDIGGAYFAGSHPIAGSEKSGVRSADVDLFKGAYCVVTKTRNSNLKALNKIKRFWTAIGMKVIEFSPEIHDRIFSRVSHLPHASSVSLVNAVGRDHLDLAAGGFRDSTRIASGEPALWQDIFFTNRKNLIKDIGALKKELSKIESALRSNNQSALRKILNKAKLIRDSL